MTRGRHITDLSSSTVFRVILILLGFWLLYLILDIILMIFGAIILASVMEPAANWASRYKIPRAVTVLIIYLLVIAALSGAVTLFIDPLTTQLKQLSETVPYIVETVQARLAVSPQLSAQVTASLQQNLLKLGEGLSGVSANIFAGTRSFFSGTLAILFVFIIAFYLTVEKDALKKFAKIVTPKHHYNYVANAITRAQKQIARWLLAQVALGIIIGVVVGVGLWILGVPYALLLGLISGILEIIPVIGPIIAAVPGVAVGLTQSFTLGIGALVFYVIVQQLENHVLIPHLMRKAVGLNPLVTIITILVGARLAGVVGMLLAVPVATVIGIFLADIFAQDD